MCNSRVIVFKYNKNRKLKIWYIPFFLFLFSSMFGLYVIIIEHINRDIDGNDQKKLRSMSKLNDRPQENKVGVPYGSRKEHPVRMITT